MSNLLHDNHYTVGELTKTGEQVNRCRSALNHGGILHRGKLSVALCAEENTADFYDVGLVVFSDAAKARILGVRPETLARYTAVSEQTVTEMAASIRDIAGRISASPSADTLARKGRRRHGGGDGLFCVEHTWRDENPYRAFLRRLSGRGGKSGAFFAGRAGNSIVGRK